MHKNNLLLLHGALGTKEQLNSLKDKLSHHFEVFTLNFEGHGDRASDKDFSIELFVENALSFIREINISKTHIFGYSMGGYVALQLTLNHPDVVDRIVTLGTKFNWTKEVAEQEVKMLNPEKIKEKVPAFAKHLEELHIGNNWKNVMQKTAQMMVNLGDGKKIKNKDLGNINNSVLIGIGELDKMVTLEESEHAMHLLPNGRLKVIEGFKHPIEMVNMSELALIIQKFMDTK